MQTLTFNDLRRYLRNLLPINATWSSSLANYTWTHYKDCYIVTCDINKPKRTFFSLQKSLEKYRPTIDYLQIDQDRIIVGFTTNYESMRKSAIELIYSTLSNHMKESLRIHQFVLNQAKHFEASTSLITTNPEFFL